MVLARTVGGRWLVLINENTVNLEDARVDGIAWVVRSLCDQSMPLDVPALCDHYAKSLDDCKKYGLSGRIVAGDL